MIAMFNSCAGRSISEGWEAAKSNIDFVDGRRVNSAKVFICQPCTFSQPSSTGQGGRGTNGSLTGGDLDSCIGETLATLQVECLDNLVIQFVPSSDCVGEAHDVCIFNALNMCHETIRMAFRQEKIKAYHLAIQEVPSTDSLLLKIQEWACTETVRPDAIHIPVRQGFCENGASGEDRFIASCSANSIQVIANNDTLPSGILDIVPCNWICRYTVIAKCQSVIINKGYIYDCRYDEIDGVGSIPSL